MVPALAGMVMNFRARRSEGLRRFVRSALIVTFLSAVSTSVGAQSTQPEQVAPQEVQAAPSANTGMAPGDQAPAATYPPNAAPPPAPGTVYGRAPDTVHRPAPGTVYRPAPGAPYPPPAGAPYYAGAETYRPGPRISRGLLIGGASALGASYLVSATIGLAIKDLSGPQCIDCADVGPWLFLPVLGPFVGAGRAVEDAGVFILLGVAQVVSLGLLIGGVVRYKNTKRRAQEQSYVFELRHNRSLALDMASTPRFSGPQLNLRF